VTELNGVMLSDEIVLRGSLDMDPDLSPRRDPAVLDGWLAWPRSQLDQVEDWTPGRAWLRSQALGYQVEAYGAALHPLARDETHIRSLEVLGPALKADLSMVYISGADQLSHQFWPFVDPRGVAAMAADPGLRKRSATQLLQLHAGKRRVPLSDGPTSQEDLDTGARWIVDYYRYLDQVLARVLARLEKTQSTLLICSDHGFRVGDMPVPLFADHRDPALLIGWGARVRPGARARAEVTMLDIAPTLYAMLGIPAASDMRGRLLDDLFDLQALPPVPSRVRKVAGAVPGAPADHPRRSQLEALGYIDGQGTPIPQPGSR
jgi:predicted AlkP superfamily phosphohydrolase/phosphomutase